jgi:hypothetical protein
MHYDLLSKRDLKAIDALIDSYGGAKAVREKITAKREYANRKKAAADKGYGEMLEKAEKYVTGFPKVEDFIASEGARHRCPGSRVRM